MALQRQELVIPLGVTMNEGVPRELLPRGQLYDIQNGRVKKPGLLEKRFGYELLAGGLGTDTDGSTMTSPCQRLLRCDKELLAVDGSNELHSYSSSRDQWKPRALAPEIQILDRKKAGQNYYRGLTNNCVTARIGNYLAVAWDDTIDLDQVVCRVYDTVTGALLIEKVDVSNRRAPRLIAVGNHFVLACSNGTAAPWTVRAFFLDTTDTTWAWSSVTDLGTAVTDDTDTEHAWDIYPIDSTNFAFINVSDTTGNLNLYRFSVDPFTLQDSELNIRAGKVIRFPNLYVDPANTIIYVAYYNDTDSQVEVRGHSTSTLSSLWTTAVAATLTVDPALVTIGPKASGQAWVVWDIDTTGTTAGMPGYGYRQIDSTGALHASTNGQRALRIVSRPFTKGSRSYMVVMTGYGHPTGGGVQYDQSAYLVVDLGSPSSTYSPRPVARFGEGETGATSFLAQPVIVNSGDGVGFFGLTVRDPDAVWTAGSTMNGVSVDTVKLRFPVLDETDTHWTGFQEFGTNTFIPSGLPHHYDGDLVREFWSYYPWIDQISVLTGTGTLTVGLLHEYCVVWVAMDNRGRVWRSRPSIIKSATPVGTDRAIRLRIPYYTSTSQETPLAFDLVGIELYRRTLATDPFVRLFRTGIGTAEANNKLATAFLQVDDTGGSHSLSQLNLYTNGGVLEAFTPPPCVQSVIFDNRLWIFDRNKLFYTREILDGEGPAFHPAQTIVVGDEANITAMATMDSNFIIFKDESIFFIQGAGPDDTGQGASYSVPQRIMSPVGCTNIRSVTPGKDGIYFESRRGIERLRRDLTVEYVGERVEDTFAGVETLTSASHVQRDGEIRFTVESQAISQLVYDEITDVWSKDVFHLGAVTEPISSVVVDGSYYWLENSSVRVYKETPGAYSDEGYSAGIVDLWVTLRCETGDIIINSPTAEVQWWRAMLFARRGDAHDLTFEYALNNSDSFTFKSWTAAEIATWMQIPIELVEVLPSPQRARTIRFRITDTTSGTPKRGPLLYSISLEFGVEEGVARVPAAQRK